MAHDYVFGFWNDRTKAQVHPADDVYTKDQADYIFATYSVVADRYTPRYSYNHSSWDTAPTSDSTKPVTSGGIKSALDALDAAIDARLDALEALVPEPSQGDMQIDDWLVEEGSMTTAHDEINHTDDPSANTYWNNKNVTWHYRKWNSGRIEAWGTQEDTWNIVDAWGGNLYRGHLLSRQELPYTGSASDPQYILIDKPDLCDVKIIGDTASLWTVCGNKSKLSRSSTYAFFPVTDGGADNAWANQAVTIEYHIIGRWK